MPKEGISKRAIRNLNRKKFEWGKSELKWPKVLPVLDLDIKPDNCSDHIDETPYVKEEMMEELEENFEVEIPQTLIEPLIWVSKP